MKNLILSGLFSIFLSLFLGKITLPFLLKLKAGQPILKYVKAHKEKNGTPTMGGLFFIISTVIVFLAFGGAESHLAIVAVVIGLAFMVVGFIDDLIKIRRKQNEGLKAYQKVIFQLSIAILAGVFVYRNGITTFYLPFSKSAINVGFFSVPIVAIIFIAITNSVNLTDGIDGLAGSVSVVYLVIISIIICLQKEIFANSYLLASDSDKLILLSICTAFSLLGFLCYNVNKAKVFMGDTGSLALGGLIGAISIFSLNTMFIPVIGIMFVLSSISVIIQVVHYKKTKKRIFLMAPLHHHFQLKGVSEAKITFCYSLITLACGMLAVLSYV